MYLHVGRTSGLKDDGSLSSDDGSSTQVTGITRAEAENSTLSEAVEHFFSEKSNVAGPAAVKVFHNH